MKVYYSYYIPPVIYLKDVRPEGWGLTPPYLEYLESEDNANSTNDDDLKKLFPPAYFVRLVGRLTHALQVENKFSPIVGKLKSNKYTLCMVYRVHPIRATFGGICF